MNLNQPTLVQFENERKANKYIPPLGSNSFYNIGSGSINILTKRDDPEGCRFDLFTKSGNIYSGIGNFEISGDIKNPDLPYENMTVIENTTLSINNHFTVSKGRLEVHGTVNMMQYSYLMLRDNATVIFYPDSKFIINKDTQIVVEKGSTLTLYGDIDIHLDMVDSLVNVDGIIIDSAAVMNVDGLDTLGNRQYSLTDYYTELSKRIINIHTQGEKNFANGRIGYTWTGGTPANRSQLIKMSVLWGEAILGDFKLSVLGYPDTDIPDLQMISEIHIKEDTTLYISEEYNGYTYIRPELYLGIVIGNNKVTANCIVDGTLIADGVNALITLDRGSTIHINETGSLYLKNGAVLRSTYNETDEVLFINGTLIIDNIEQINSFVKENIVFGDNGKLIILNPDTGEKKLLFTIPNQIESTDLYRLFKDRIDHIEYHISNNNGIGIDQYYEFYAREFTSWFGGRRIEQAIKDGILVWHDGGFIELYSDITPWVTTSCTLLEASRIFKTFGSYDSDKLQDAVDRLKYAGCGNILFRFIENNNVGEVLMVLDDINMINVVNHPLSDKYILTTDADGELFLRNRVGQATSENIINEKSKVLEIVDKKVEFELEE